MVPLASMAAVGSGSVRRLATWWSLSEEMVTLLFQLAPPLVEVKVAIDDEKKELLRKGTITVPLGWTSGWPPRPVALSPVDCAALHVVPPSLDILICTRSLLEARSHSR